MDLGLSNYFQLYICLRLFSLFLSSNTSTVITLMCLTCMLLTALHRNLHHLCFIVWSFPNSAVFLVRVLLCKIALLPELLFNKAFELNSTFLLCLHVDPSTLFKVNHSQFQLICASQHNYRPQQEISECVKDFK